MSLLSICKTIQIHVTDRELTTETVNMKHQFAMHSACIFIYNKFLNKVITQYSLITPKTSKKHSRSYCRRILEGL